MTTEEVVRRARSQVGLGTHYKLGRGGMDPNAPRAAQKEGGRWLCDCSGYASYCLGVSRDQTDRPGYEEGWIETSRICGDAQGDHDLFLRVDDARPGDLVVYPDRGGHEGHVGVVTETIGGLPSKVAHCCARRGLSDAIIEEDARVFWIGAIRERGAIYARFKDLIEEEELKADKPIKTDGKTSKYKAAFSDTEWTNYVPLAAIKPYLRPGVTLTDHKTFLDIKEPKS